MSEPTYIEGPISEPWTVNDSGCTIYVERRGCDDRMREVFTPPYEPAFICDQPEQAQALCERLNRLDALEAAIKEIHAIVWDMSVSQATDMVLAICETHMPSTQKQEDSDEPPH
jgi:hypothetical protein